MLGIDRTTGLKNFPLERHGANIYDGIARLYEWIAAELDRESDDLIALKEFPAKK